MYVNGKTGTNQAVSLLKTRSGQYSPVEPELEAANHQEFCGILMHREKDGSLWPLGPLFPAAGPAPDIFFPEANS
jgi:hypothetical protein